VLSDHDNAERPLPAPQQRLLVRRHIGDGEQVTQEDELIEETPVALVFNGLSHAVMLATPQALEDLALGFALTEGLLTHPDELFELELLPGCDGVQVAMRIASARFMALKERRRNLAGRTGCGLCGVDSLQAVHRIPPGAVASRSEGPDATALSRALSALREHQPLHQATGAAHAAAWIGADGQPLEVCEDVGRHNALDKLIGRLARRHRRARPLADDPTGFVLVSSRASYEMVQKVAMAGGRTLVAVSAPTALAVREAQAAGLRLIGFARDGRWTDYSGPPPDLPLTVAAAAPVASAALPASALT
jgi:FdhD protein